MKELEIEYKNQISLETPDLWSRIEEGIDKYEASKVIEPIEKTQNTNIEEIEIKDKKRKSANVMPIIIKTTAAAACLLLAVGVFNIMLGRNMNKDATSTTDSYSESAEETMSADTACAESESIYEEATAVEEAATAEEAAPAEAASEMEQDNSIEKTDSTYSFNGDNLNIEADNKEEIAEVLECSTQDASYLIVQLNLVGIKVPKQFEIIDEENSIYKQKRESISYGEDSLIASFVDGETEEKYIMYYVIGSNNIEIRAILRDDESGEVVYEIGDKNN